MTGWVRPSGCAAGDCVEARTSPASAKVIEVRRRKGPMITGVLTMTRTEFAAFAAGIRNDDFRELEETP